MNTRGLPGMFAPTYHESASGNSVEYATSVTCAIHASSADGVASAVEYPCDPRYTTQSLIHSTCCSIDSTMLLNTDGDPGPVTMNMFGKPGGGHPQVRVRPGRPLLGQRDPADTPDVDPEQRPGDRVEPGREHDRVQLVAESAVVSPPAYTDAIGADRMSTSVTLGRLNIA